jgi:hypothetical protein
VEVWLVIGNLIEGRRASKSAMLLALVGATDDSIHVADSRLDEEFSRPFSALTAHVLEGSEGPALHFASWRGRFGFRHEK